MKTKLLKMITVTAFFALPFAMQAQTTVYNVNPTGDGIVANPLDVTTFNPFIDGNGVDGTVVLKVGNSDMNGDANVTSAIIPFKLPVRPAGKSVLAANLKINIAYFRHWIDTDVDLYGLPYNSLSSISADDHYSGTYPDPTGDVTGIQDAFIIRDVGGTGPAGTLVLTDREVNSDTSGDSLLLSYINAQYDAGAVGGDYVFLRLSIDPTSGSNLAGAHYYGISDESTAEAPELMLEIEDAEISSSKDYTLYAPTEDGYVSDPVIVTVENPYLWGAAKLGKSDRQGQPNTTSVIIPFQLPVRPDGETVDFANLNVYVSYGREWLNANVDLYGLTFQEATADGGTGREIFNTDHYAGAYPDATTGVAAIEDDYFAKNVAAGVLDTPRWEETTSEANLVAYLNAQYIAGAVAGDWVFLRLSMDNDAMAGSQYFNIEGGDSATPAALEIGFSGVIATASVNDIEKSALGLYPNPVTDGRLRVSLDGFSNDASLEIYSITGKMVHSEKIDARSRDSFETQLNLNSGLYIVKLQDGERAATRKLIVQ